MKKTFIITSATAGNSGNGKGKIFFTNAKGETIKISAKVCALAGIDEEYRGAIQYSVSSHKKGEPILGSDKLQLVNAEGVKQTYFDDCDIINNVATADFASLKASKELDLMDLKEKQLARLLAD